MKQVGAWLSAWCGRGREEGIPPLPPYFPLTEHSLKLFPPEVNVLPFRTTSSLIWHEYVPSEFTHTVPNDWPWASSIVHAFPHPVATLSLSVSLASFLVPLFMTWTCSLASALTHPFLPISMAPLWSHKSSRCMFLLVSTVMILGFYLWAPAALPHTLSVVSCTPMKVCRRHQYLHQEWAAGCQQFARIA